jgi:phosphohistidine phosphatase
MILLVHHAEAVAPTVDSARPLSARGLEEVARLAERAAARGVKPDVIWHSGKLRARQTAEAFWRAGNPLAPLAAVRGLLPDDPPEWMRDRLAGEHRDVVVAGHMPHIEKLLRLLVAGRTDDRARSFPQHGCVALEPAEGSLWRELWRDEPRRHRGTED